MYNHCLIFICILYKYIYKFIYIYLLIYIVLSFLNRFVSSKATWPVFHENTSFFFSRNKNSQATSFC